MKLYLFVLISLFFSLASVLGYSFKRRAQIRARIASKKLYEDAQRYFVTICRPLLTSFGSEDDAGDYMTFRICGDNFMVVHKIHMYGSEYFCEVVMKVKFKGSTLIDLRTSREYSYGDFEHHLRRFLGDSLVYAHFMKHMWEQFKKESKEQT